MTIDFTRIAQTVNVPVLAKSRVAIVGCGGSHHLATSLARSGVPRFTLIDGDLVQPENLCRTDYLPEDVGQTKAAVLGNRLRDLGCEVDCHETWFQPDVVGPRPSLMIAATDSFNAQAAVNQFAVQRGIPALYVGLTSEGLGGEIVFWYRGLPCFRCLLSNRYQQRQGDPSSGGDPSSAGTTLFDLGFLDSVAGHIALGLLLRGTPTRFGRLMETLGDRNFLRLKIDPEYRLASGRDRVREELGISADNPHFAGWCVSVQNDPAKGDPPCADCAAAGHRPYHESRAIFSLVPRSHQDEKTTVGQDPYAAAGS